MVALGQIRVACFRHRVAQRFAEIHKKLPAWISDPARGQKKNAGWSVRPSVLVRLELVAGGRYVPNTQFLSIPFRNELIHSAAQVSELSDCTRGFV